MWRTSGKGEFYTYLPPDFDENQAVCTVPPQSLCNDVYGASVGRGSFSWTTGGRLTISQRVRLNDAGQSNGEVELFVAGKSVINVGGLVLSDTSSGRIRGMQMQTFFGGEFCHIELTMPIMLIVLVVRLRLDMGVAKGPICVFLRLLRRYHRKALRNLFSWETCCKFFLDM